MAGSIKDVARRAGVSISTVSRIINGTAAVKPEKEALVREAMEYYQYVPSQFGRALVKQQSYLIGVYYPYIGSGSLLENPINLEILRGHDSAVCETEYGLVLLNESGSYIKNKAQRPKFAKYIEGKKIDGLLMSFYGADERIFNEVKRFLDMGFPIGWIGNDFCSKGIVMDTGQRDYLYDVFWRLYEKGHRKVACICSFPSELSFTKANLKAAAARICTAFPDLDVSFCAPETFLADVHCFEKISAVVAASAKDARRLLTVCHENHIAVPQDISAICLEYAPDLAMDSIKIPFYRLGEVLALRLLDDIGHKTRKTYGELKVQYISRGTTRNISGKK